MIKPLFTLRNLKPLVLTIASAVSFSLALPNELIPYGSALIGSVCLVPYFLSIYMADSYRFALILGLFFGFINGLISNYWLMFFQDFSVWTLGGTVLGYTIYNMVLAAYLFMAIKTMGVKGKLFRPVLVAFIWTGYEYLKSSGFLGYPWGLAAYPFQGVLPMIQFADITGVWGITFIVILLNSTISEFFFSDNTGNKNIGFRHLSFLFVLLIAITVYGVFKLSSSQENSKTFTFFLIQQNTDPWSEGGGERGILKSEELTENALKEKGIIPDLVVWSESTLVYPAVGYGNYYERFPRKEPLLPYIRKHGIYLLTGAPVLLWNKKVSKGAWNYMQAMNSTVLYNSHAQILYYYGKQHPVPFAESIPFWNIQWVRDLFKNIIGIQNVWVMGNRPVIFDLPLKNNILDGDSVNLNSLKFATPICFEDAFPYINREFAKLGAEVLINLTNDAWSKTVSSETQHFVASRFRTIETRRYLLRSTVAGVTSIIDTRGRIVSKLPLFKEGYLYGKIRLPSKPSVTIYMTLGDFFPVMSIAVVLIFMLLSAFYTYHSVWLQKIKSHKY